MLRLRLADVKYVFIFHTAICFTARVVCCWLVLTRHSNINDFFLISAIAGFLSFNHYADVTEKAPFAYIVYMWVLTSLSRWQQHP